MFVCGECGAENRDRARFCRGCALPLVAVTVVEELDTVAEEPGLAASRAGPGQKKSTRPCPACSAPNPRRSLSCLACGAPLGRRRKDLVRDAAASDGTPPATAPAAPASRSLRSRTVKLGLLVLVVGTVAWWYSVFRAHLPTVAPVVPASAQAPQSTAPAPTPSPVVEASPVVPALSLDATPAVTQLNQAVEEVRAREERKESERVAAQERARAARIAERQRVQEARELAAREAAAAAAAAVAPTPAATAPAAAAVPVAPTMKTVAQTCAGETNIIARDFCRIGACRLPAHVNDAICISYRQMDAERRARMAN